MDGRLDLRSLHRPRRAEAERSVRLYESSALGVTWALVQLYQQRGLCHSPGTRQKPVPGAWCHRPCAVRAGTATHTRTRPHDARSLMSLPVSQLVPTASSSADPSAPATLGATPGVREVRRLRGGPVRGVALELPASLNAAQVMAALSAAPGVEDVEREGVVTVQITPAPKGETSGGV